uniref:LITAF domain-containing protein n=1 Tax=Parastrongyloides trichosuri TaxID=131310 RepID=A0A0N4ZMG6_PARTI
MSNEKSGIPSAPISEDNRRLEEQINTQQGHDSNNANSTGMYPNVDTTNLPPSYDEAIKNPNVYPAATSVPPVNINNPPYPPSPAGYIPTTTNPGYDPMVQNLHPLPHAGPANVTVIRSVVTTCSFGKSPVQTTCPHCLRHITTKTMETNGRRTWCIFFAIFLLGFFIPIAWCCLCIPFCSSDCQDVLHLCPHCKSVVGHFRRDI